MSRIEVVVPSYNYGRFLRECVESVLSQSETDVRVLIIDDASQDDTPRVCAELVSEDPRVEVVRHPVNLGHIATYNDGIDRARGDYLLLLSADDFLLPGALARAAAVLDADPEVGLTPGATRALGPDAALPPGLLGERTPRPISTWAMIERLARGNFVATATAVVRTSLQKALGGYLPELPHSGDLEMWLRFALTSGVTFIRAPQATYRRHETNMSNAYDAKTDFDQCVAAFRPHMDAIRNLKALGPSLAIRVDEIFAEKAARFAGPGGTSLHAPFSFFPVLPPPPVGVILAKRSGMDRALAAVRQALPRARPMSAADGVGIADLAAASPLDHFLVLEGGAGLDPRQILALTRRLEAEPDRAHGACGGRVEVHDSHLTVRAPIIGLDGPVSFLTGVVAFSKAQAIAAKRLGRRLAASGPAESAAEDAVLISCAGPKPPICHDLGPVAGLPEAADGRGGDVLDRLLALEAIRIFKPMSARRGPWGARRRSVATASQPSDQP